MKTPFEQFLDFEWKNITKIEIYVSRGPSEGASIGLKESDISFFFGKQNASLPQIFPQEFYSLIERLTNIRFNGVIDRFLALASSAENNPEFEDNLILVTRILEFYKICIIYNPWCRSEEPGLPAIVAQFIRTKQNISNFCSECGGRINHLQEKCFVCERGL